ncbi:hypothetical protein PSACC_02999 [Paramicrosporidium saccamoebae]|uniref:Uncharacterized protein n=1 Tax=Paramicrosporidium saccamoebae TaxID=1246581 RepID=A0A2H9THF0_9FUNG|nr:hypothetical protein PSACC_02999 [Paramicrosporidium saccamoebae]
MPGTLDPLVFAKARTAEVLLLKKEIQDGEFRGARRVFQTLSRSMRRRAASYNIRRLPVRLRQKALDEAAKDPSTVQKAIKKPPCRRRRRRMGDIAKNFESRMTSKRWLETHLWHAKRAKMDNLWGYRIAVRSNEKCRKSCIRASVAKCFLYDSSYHEIVQFSHPFGEFLEMIEPHISAKIHANSTTLGHFFWNTDLSHNGIIIGPAKLILTVQEGLPILRAIVHPLISSRIQVLLPQATVVRGEYSMFELEGSQSPEFLSCILSMQFKYPQVCSSNIYEWSCKDPRFAFPQKLTDRREPCDSDLTSIDGDFWSKSGSVHRKSQKEINDLLSLHTIPGTKLQPTEADPRMPVLLIFETMEQIIRRKHHRVTVIVPKGWGSALWRSLIFAGARFGGLEERQAVDAEHGRPVFPNDYPSSSAYLPYSEKLFKELEDKWNRRPPAKRINYSRLGIQQPFRIDLSLLGENCKICRLECTGRGVPEWNGRVFIDGQLVGFITTGFYSQTHGKGIAFATCAIQNLPIPTQQPTDPIQQLTCPIQVSISGFEGPHRSAIITKIF